MINVLASQLRLCLTWIQDQKSAAAVKNQAGSYQTRAMETRMSLNKDKIAGLLLVILGIGAYLEGRSHSLGTLTQMGSGYFPVALGVVLVLIGLLLFVTSSPDGQDKPAVPPAATDLNDPPHLSLDHCPPTDWRGVSCIIGSVISFIWVGHLFGLIPATWICVFMAAMGDRTSTYREAAILSLLMCALAVGLFHTVLHVQFPLIQFPFWKA